MTNPRLTAMLAPAFALFLLVGCGSQPPSVDNARDIARLPANQMSVGARGLRDHDIPALARLRDLRDLDFYRGWGVMDGHVTDEGLRQLSLLDLPKLELVHVGECQGITDKGLECLGTLQTINYVGLTGCRGISDAGLPGLLRARSLTGLDLSGCPGITDAGLQVLAAKTDWFQISLDGCLNITAAGLANLKAAVPSASISKDDAAWASSNR